MITEERGQLQSAMDSDCSRREEYGSVVDDARRVRGVPIG